MECAVKEGEVKDERVGGGWNGGGLEVVEMGDTREQVEKIWKDSVFVSNF